ncbi:MAG: class I SAM-dependent methyltransferase [Defluviitaleaceae bacterium]|nr:class I SAM-dependent methyltransferase [Defluviitaleaceae bacterium]
MDKANMKSMKEYYDATAKETAENWYSNEMMLPLLKRFVGMFDAKPRILDAGCGTGCESMRLANLGADVVGVDVSEESIKIAQMKNPNCRFELMDVKQLDDSIGVFDGIVSLGMIIHIQDCDLQMAFDNFSKAIKPEGFLFLAFVAGDGFCEKRSYLDVNGEKYNRNFYLHQPERIIEMAQKSAFKYYEEWFLEGKFGQWKFLVFNREL